MKHDSVWAEDMLAGDQPLVGEYGSATTVTSIPMIPTLYLRALSQEKHDLAKDAFEALSDRRFFPFNQLDEDPSRAELDRVVLVDLLDLDPALCAPGGPMDLLRRKLAAEPQIHGSKQTRVVFTEDGETTAPVI